MKPWKIFTVLLGLGSLAGNAQVLAPPAESAVQLPPVTVTARKEKENPIFGGNSLFDSTFANLAGGPLIEAILWRHRFLANHPGEDAVILTTVRGHRLVSATILHTRNGKVYVSSNALGENVPVRSLVPADLHRAAGLSQAARLIDELRQVILNAPPLIGGPANIGQALIRAEESGNYLPFRPATTTPAGMMAQATSVLSALPGTDFSHVSAQPVRVPTTADSDLGASIQVGQAEAARQSPLMGAAVQATMNQGFDQPSSELVSLTYEGLHNPAHAGLVPVALDEMTYRNARVPCIVFDWEGVQYTYQPDRGTTAQPMPVSSLTGLPDLCVRNGALIECVYFCAVFGKQHPDSRPALIPGDPVAAAYQREGKLGLFIPTLGGFALPSPYLKALDDPEYLAQIRDQVAAAKKAPEKAADAIPQEISGDDGDMQMRRAFLAFQAAGIPCQLSEDGAPALAFTWKGVAYAYGPDQRIRSSVATPAPKSPTALVGPAINLAETKVIQVVEPEIPDNTPDLPDLTWIPAPAPAASRVAGGTEASRSATGSTQPGKLVVMPPFVVATTRPSRNPWRYAAVSGYEVLSRASDEATAWDLDGLQHGIWIQDAVIPKEWLPRLPVPCTVIIDNTNLATVRKDQPHSQSLKFAAPPDPLAWGQLSGRVHDAVEPISSDGETFAVNSNVYGVETTGVTYDSINLDRLLRATPPLPAWVIAGLLGREGLFREGFLITAPSWQELGTADAIALSHDNDSGGLLSEAHGPGTLWISLAETQRLLQQLKQDKTTRIPLLPLADFFAETPPSGPGRPLWDSEAGLLLRWGLMGPGHQDRVLSQAFLSLVRRARREPVTEKLFADCFGFGYGAMEDKLEPFLRSALATPTEIHGLKMPYRFATPKLRKATADETGRILGDWIRMQAETLRPHDPPASRAFLAAAEAVLLRAYREDNALPNTSPADAISADLIRDPKLLAVYGLYEHDIGQDGKARELLEAAVKAGVLRPRAYQVLAELRFAEAVTRPLGANRRISAPQAAAVLEPLKKVQRYPASLANCELMVDTWGRCEAPAGADDLAALAAGAARFPRAVLLAYKTAVVCARAGHRDQAEQLVRQGLIFATEEADRSRLEQLRLVLDNPTVGYLRK